jgi:hypothetical protein
MTAVVVTVSVTKTVVVGMQVFTVTVVSGTVTVTVIGGPDVTVVGLVVVGPLVVGLVVVDPLVVIPGAVDVIVEVSVTVLVVVPPQADKARAMATSRHAKSNPSVFFFITGSFVRVSSLIITKDRRKSSGLKSLSNSPFIKERMVRQERFPPFRKGEIKRGFSILPPASSRPWR